MFESANDPDIIRLVESWSERDTFWNEIRALHFYREHTVVSEVMHSASQQVEIQIPLHGSERA